MKNLLILTVLLFFVFVGKSQTPTNPVFSGNLQLNNEYAPMSLMYNTGGSGGPWYDISFNLSETNKNISLNGGTFRCSFYSAPLFQWVSRNAGSTAENGIMSLTKEGKLGIGNIFNPSSRLTIQQLSGTNTEGVQLRNATGSSSWYMYSNASNNLTLSQGAIGTGVTLNNTSGALTMALGDYWTANATSLVFKTSASTNGNASIQSVKTKGTEYGFLALNPSGGNVGIGTAEPSAKLTFAAPDYNDLNGGLMFEAASYSNWSMSSYSDGENLIICPDQNVDYGFFLTQTGNLGLGTPSPSNVQGWNRVLDVRGTVHSKILATTENEAVRTGIYSHNTWNGGGGFIGTESNNKLFLITNYSPKMTIQTDGKVGIGVTTPDAQLHLADIFSPGGKNLLIGDDTYLTDIDVANTLGIYGNSLQNQAGIQLGNAGSLIYGINGNILIGKNTQTNNLYKLDIAGRVRADEVVINSTGADFVFSDNYKLRSLVEVENFIKANKHLPEVAPASEMQTNGVSISEMQTKLLQKVEELTLYMIEQQKVDKSLLSQIEALKKENKLLKQSIKELK